MLEGVCACARVCVLEEACVYVVEGVAYSFAAPLGLVLCPCLGLGMKT